MSSRFFSRGKKQFFENFFELFYFFSFPQTTILRAFRYSNVNTVSGVSMFFTYFPFSRP